MQSVFLLSDLPKLIWRVFKHHIQEVNEESDLLLRNMKIYPYKIT